MIRRLFREHLNNYFILVVEDNNYLNFIHSVIFKEKISKECYNMIYNELLEDKTFGLKDGILSGKYKVIIANEDQNKKLNNIFMNLDY
jgi:hypothetical protein